jgi:hypothetical protein
MLSSGQKNESGKLNVFYSSSESSINGQVSLVSANGKSTRFDPQTQEDIKLICVQMRNTDFRERIDAIEKFQVLCETSTEIAMSNIVPVRGVFETKNKKNSERHCFLRKQTKK